MRMIMQKITQNYVHRMNIARDIERENVCWNEWLKEQENTTD